MLHIRTKFLSAVVASCAFVAPAAAQEDPASYPSRDILFIVPYAAGGPTDILARVIAQKLQEEFKQTVVIENKPGGNGSIGAVLAARSEPDGYTMYLGGISTMSVAPALSSELPYDPNEDFAPVSMASKQSLMLMVATNFPATSLKEYIAAAKKDPGGISFATSGNGTSGHMAGAAFEIATGTKLNHIPYKGSAPALNDLMAGQVNSMFGTMLAAVPNVRTGAIKALAVSGPTRSSALPDVPTFAEEGLADYDPGAWNAIFVAAKTPPAIIAKLNSALKIALSAPELVEKLSSDGSKPEWSTPEALSEFMKGEQAKWKEVVSKGGIENQ